MVAALSSNNIALSQNLSALSRQTEVTRKLSNPNKAGSRKPGTGKAESKRSDTSKCRTILERALETGNLKDGEQRLSTELLSHPDDDQGRFGLGMLQFMRTVERLAQSLHKHGMHDDTSREFDVPFLRLPTPPNPSPEKITYQKLRTIVANAVEDLTLVQTSLARVKDTNVRLPLKFGLIKMDLNGDGKAEDSETLWKVYSSLTNTEIKNEQAAHFSITFDAGDVHWLSAYCHLLSAMGEIYLAHDTKDTFERTAHLIFKDVESPYDFLTSDKKIHLVGELGFEVFDLAALLHTIRWEVVEPERMSAALNHFEAMIEENDEMWKCIISENDNDREWIPNPRQTGVIPDIHVTEEMISAWTGLMGKIEKILSGELLVAFWRTDDSRGINVRRVFTEPRTLDLVLWIQGTAAAPYLEQGPRTEIESWRSLQSAFGSELPGFAIWFN